jgi:YfiH family protein
VRLRKVITTRAGGVSKPPYDSFNLGGGVGDDPQAVQANRHRLAGELGLGDGRLAWMEQVHGRKATVVKDVRDSPAEATDALITTTPGFGVVALVADCVPILLGDVTAGVIAAVHAGRIGARIGVLPAAIEAMVQLGARPNRMEALLGPAACGECYEVPSEMQADVSRHLPGSASRTRKGTAGLDLRAGLWHQLAAAGVARVGIDPRCTIEDHQLFSHRRDGKTGRLAAVAWLDEDA